MSSIAKFTGRRYQWNSAFQQIMLVIAFTNTPDEFFGIDISRQEGLPTYFHFLVAHILFGIPFLYMELFIGKYSRTGCLVFGRLMPIAVGIGYTMLLIALYQLIVYGALMTNIINYLMLSLSTEMPWLKCPPHQPECIDITTSSGVCTADSRLSTELYFKSLHLMNAETRSVRTWQTLIPLNAIILLVMWFGVFLYSLRLQEFRFTMRWSVCTQLVFNVLLTILIYIADANYSFFIKLNMRQLNSFFNVQAWCIAISRASRTIGLHYGVHILFGSYMRLDQPVDNMAIMQDIILYALSLMYSMLIYICYEIILQKTGCNLFVMPVWNYSGKRKLFIIVPHALGYLGIAQLWTFIYFSCCFFASINCLITRMSFIYCCLSEEFSHAQFYRSYIFGFICLIGFVLGVPQITDQGFILIELVLDGVGRFLFMLLSIVALVVYRFYSVDRLVIDIQFLTGNRPPLFWIICWNLSLLVSILEYVYFRQSFISLDNIVEYSEIFITITQVTLILPIAFGVFYAILKKLKEHNLTALFTPTELWGPPNQHERKNRKLFNPKTETRCSRLVDSCDHNCFHNSTILERAIELEKKMRKKHFDGEDSELVFQNEIAEILSTASRNDLTEEIFDLDLEKY